MANDDGGTGRRVVVIVRHGKAEADSVSGRDHDRELAERGEAQARFLAEQLVRGGAAGRGGVGRVVSSLAARAFSTAAPIAAAAGVEHETDGRLAVDEPASGALDLIYGMCREGMPGGGDGGGDGVGDGGGGALVFVGHNPQVSVLVSVLAHGSPSAGAGVKTGEANVFEVEFGDGEVGARHVARLRGERWD